MTITITFYISLSLFLSLSQRNMIGQADREEKIFKTPLINNRQANMHEEVESEKSRSSLQTLVGAENCNKITVLTICYKCATHSI
jgi:hypothetical protein